jgi:hypothetical protein
MANEIIKEITDSVSPDEVEETSSASNQEQPATEQDPRLAPIEEELTAIPEKFHNKTQAEIIKSYLELEKHAGKISSERAQEKKAAEEAKNRAEQLERQLQQASFSSQQTQSNQRPVSEPQDPFKSFDEEFESDPKKAIRSGLERARDEARLESARAREALLQQDQASYYERLKKENQEFQELEPEMTRLAQQFGGYLKPEALRSRQVIDLMFNLARGQNVEKIVKRAVETTKKSSELVRDEKKRGFL